LPNRTNAPRSGCAPLRRGYDRALDGVALLFAALADGVVKGAGIYKRCSPGPTVAAAIAGVLWWFLFNPTVGILSRGLAAIGIDWNTTSIPVRRWRW